MKKLLLCLLLLPASLWAFQKPAKATAAAKDQGNLTLVCKIVNLPANFDSLTLYEYIGLATKPIVRTGRQIDSSFAFVLPRGKARFYGVGWAENGLARVILGEEPAVTLWANAQYMDKARTVNSPANRAYEDMRRRTEALRLEGETHRTAYRQAADEKNGALQKAITERFVRLSKAKTRYLDSLKTANPLVWHSATLQLTPDPEATGEKEAKGLASATELVARSYFQYANFADRGYDDVPDVFDAFEAYAKLLSGPGLSGDQAKPLADAQLAKIPSNSKAYRMALGGLVAGFKTGQSPLYPAYAQQYLAAYRNLSYGEVGRVEYELNRAGAFTPGLAAPDLAGPTPEGQTLALSQLRGKYVLVDFWASWCGPCRRENPHVKALYDKYSGKGFEVFGVSLDRERAPWLKAIETDGLTWKHISDLKGWNSEHAKIYSVTSIPQTVLLDREGKIVARNLRGEDLKNKLADIFGE